MDWLLNFILLKKETCDLLLSNLGVFGFVVVATVCTVFTCAVITVGTPNVSKFILDACRKCKKNNHK